MKRNKPFTIPPIPRGLVYLGRGPLKGYKKLFATHVASEPSNDERWVSGKWRPSSKVVHYAAPIGSELAQLNTAAKQGGQP